jgi:hypothetical protein
MAVVTPTHDGDLTADVPAIALDLDSRTLFAAWRDEGLQRVRVARFDVATGAETGTLVLSPPASATTAPAGLAVDGIGGALLVTCRAAAGDVICQVDRVGFAEVDRGTAPGTDGVPLPSGAGPVIGYAGFPYLAPATAANAHLTTVNLATPATFDITSTVTGMPSALALSRDTAWALEGLSGYAGAKGLMAYVSYAPTTVFPLDVSDDVGGAPTGATAVRAIGAAPASQRFVVLLDSDVAALFTWDALSISQLDADPVTAGVQAIPLPPSAAGASSVGFFAGAVP